MNLAVFFSHEERTVTVNTDDLRIRTMRELMTPAELLADCPRDDAAHHRHDRARACTKILHGADDRLLVVIGPCSIHDPDAALEYAARLVAERRRLAGGLDRDAGLFREAAHHRRLEGPDQRSAPGRQLRHQRGPAHGAQLLLELNRWACRPAASFST